MIPDNILRLLDQEIEAYKLKFNEYTPFNIYMPIEWKAQLYKELNRIFKCTLKSSIEIYRNIPIKYTNTERLILE